jgi:hypothetical protein
MTDIGRRIFMNVVANIINCSIVCQCLLTPMAIKVYLLLVSQKLSYLCFFNFSGQVPAESTYSASLGINSLPLKYISSELIYYYKLYVFKRKSTEQVDLQLTIQGIFRKCLI